MYTENYEQEIDLKDLFFAVLYRWRVLLLAAVLGACILGGYKGISGGQSEEQNVPEGLEQEAEQYDSEKAALEASIINLEITIEAQNHYITEAPIMQINPYNEAVASAELLIQSNELENGKIKNLLNGYEYALLNGSYLKEAAADVGTEPRYLKELLRVEQKEINGEGQEILWNMQSQEPVGKILSVWAVGEDKQEAEELLSAVLEETEVIHQKLEAEIGTHDVLIWGPSNGEQVDQDLLDYQEKVRGNVASLQKNLDSFIKSAKELQKPEEISVSEKTTLSLAKYAAIGFIGAGFAAAFAIVMMYILNDKVSSEKEVVSRFRVKELGSFSRLLPRRLFGFVDRWLHNMAGDNKVWPEDAVFEMIVTNICNYAEDKKSLFVTGLSSKELLDRVCAELKKRMPELEIEGENDLIASASARKKMAEHEGVILVEERNVSRYSGIQQELEIIGNVGIEVIGVIVG